jgi:hypothetical protein
MRLMVLLSTLLAGCAFEVHGTHPTASDPGAAGGDPASGDPAGGSAAPDPMPGPVSSTPDPASGAGQPDLAMSAPADMAAALRVGIACTDDKQCDSGLFCAKTSGAGPTKIDVPGGYCTLDCHVNRACPSGSLCVTLSVGSFCQSLCPPDPCRAGYKCCGGGNQKTCTASQLCQD